MGSRRPPKLYRINTTSSGTNYRLLADYVPTDFPALYHRAWAACRVLGYRHGSGPLVARAVALLADRLERECERKGLDWRSELPPDSPAHEHGRGRLDKLEKKRKRKPQVDT
jgi:hypothetical protein